MHHWTIHWVWTSWRFSGSLRGQYSELGMDVAKGVWEIRPTTKWHMRLPERLWFPCFCPFLASPCQGQRKKVKGKPGYQPWVPNFLFWPHPSGWQLLTWPLRFFSHPSLKWRQMDLPFPMPQRLERGEGQQWPIWVLTGLFIFRITARGNWCTAGTTFAHSS